jgi:predicted permease
MADHMWQDLRYAFVSLSRARGLAIAAILTIGLGLSANVIVYAIVDGLILRPLPFGDRSARLVTLHSTHPTQAQDWDNSDISYPDLADLRERARTFEAIEGLFTRNLSLSTAEEAERVAGASVTPALFGLLGIAPALGRSFTEADAAEPGLESVVIISHRLWERLFASDPAAVGRTTAVNGRNLIVIGVMPEGFEFPEHHDVWLPYRTAREAGRERRTLLAVGLLRPGIALGAARAEVNAMASQLASAYPETNRQWGIHVLPLRDLFVTEVTRRNLTAMLVAVGLVLLAACANVASLLVARGVGRQRELTVRTALGASRARITRLLLAESLVLSIAGAGVALIAASWGLDALVTTMPEPPVYWARIEIDGRVLAFTVLLTIVTTIAAGLLPAFRVWREQIAPGVLQNGRDASATPDQRRLQGVLVAGQVALSLALLVAATLLARSAGMLQHADIGFDVSPLLSFRVYIAGDAYDNPVDRARAVEQIVARLQSIPGVDTAAATGAVPGDDGGDTVQLAAPRPGETGEGIGAQAVPITSRLFDTLGLELVEGRAFEPLETERPDSDAVVINKRLADAFWPGTSAIGRRLRLRSSQEQVTFRVVGVAPDLVYEEVGEETAQSRLIVYVPYARAGWRTMSVLVRARTAPASIASAARAAVRSVDPAFAPYDLLTMTERRKVTTWGERFVGRTFSAFAVVALLLACVGAYGVTAHAAAQRTREIGVRLAVGAQRRDIVALLLGRGVRLALAGAAAGLPLALGGAKLVEGLLYRTSPWMPVIWIVVPATLVFAVLLASFVPARRASLLDPVVALRQE